MYNHILAPTRYILFELQILLSFELLSMTLPNSKLRKREGKPGNMKG